MESRKVEHVPYDRLAGWSRGYGSPCGLAFRRLITIQAERRIEAVPKTKTSVRLVSKLDRYDKYAMMTGNLRERAQ